MKLQQLRYLIAVADEGSLLKAARRIGIAQPALTQQMTALEDSLSTKLLHRTARGTRLTQSGQIMVEHAKAILERTALAKRDVLERRDIVMGEISLAVSNAVAEKIVPPLLKQIAANYPLISLRISAQDSGSVRAAVENARIDLGILPEHENLRSMNAQLLFTEPMVFVTSRLEGEAAISHPIEFLEAVKKPLVVVEKTHPLRQELNQLAARHNVTLNIIAESNSLLMMRSYVESGAANCILPRCSVLDKVRLGDLQTRPIIDPEISQRYLVVWSKSRPLVRASEVVVEALRSEFLS